MVEMLFAGIPRETINVSILDRSKSNITVRVMLRLRK